VAGKLIRIFSDLHFGDRASRVSRLPQLRPLLDGIDELVLNGDSMDTRPGPRPEHTNACRAELLEFTRAGVPVTTFLTGNHDPDFSPHHLVDLAQGAVAVTHGDIVFDNIVPWGRDAAQITREISAAMAALPAGEQRNLEHRFAIWRRVAFSIPQRHQSERNPLKYAFHFALDTVCPPQRIFRVLHAWRTYSPRAAEFAHTHRPAAKFILIGHTHRPGVWRHPRGTVVVNTGSFCPPLGGYAVDVTPEQLAVREIDYRGGEFRVGETVAQFAL
jgi:predicted phosphodiesterase